MRMSHTAVHVVCADESANTPPKRYLTVLDTFRYLRLCTYYEHAHWIRAVLLRSPAPRDGDDLDLRHAAWCKPGQRVGHGAIGHPPTALLDVSDMVQYNVR